MKKEKLVPKQYITVENYRRIERYMIAYKFSSIEQTMNVMVDFIDSPLDCATFDQYVRRVFPIYRTNN